MPERYCPYCGSQKIRKYGSRTVEGKRVQDYQCAECEKRTINPLDSPEKALPAQTDFKTSLPKAKRYVITAAQNATPPHRAFLKSLLQYCNRNNAELIIVPIRYKNPTSQWSLAQQNADVWDDELRPYLYKARSDLNTNLTLLGDIKVQPTAVHPLTGFETITGGQSGIIAHPKIQLQCIPTPHHHLPKIMQTTGAVTLPNYTDTKAGKKGEFHHTFGAVVVEIENDNVFYTRTINALKNGTFIDAWLKYSPEGVEIAPPAAALIMGDTHVRFADPSVLAATFEGKKSIVGSTNPSVLVWHDLLDAYSVNPHHRNNPFVAIAKMQANYSNMRDELAEAIDFLRTRSGNRRSVIVSSNHIDFVSRWIIDHDWRRDPQNAEFYLETALAMVRSVRMSEKGAEYADPFTYWAKKELDSDQFIFPDRDQSYSVRGIEINQHGDLGPNGARGTLAGMRRIGTKSVIGHSHTPGIEEGCYQVGTSTRLRLEYNRGPSSWLNAHCLIYANGKRSLINIIDGGWRC